MKKQLVSTAVALAALGLVSNAFAAGDAGWYGGINLGRANQHLDGLDLERHDTAGAAFSGYQFNPNFAVEGAYVDLGKFDGPSGSFKARGASADAVGIIPVARDWSVFGKAGLLYAKSEFNGSHWSTEPTLGAGVSYDVTRNVSARVGWDRYFHLGNDLSGHGDVDLYTVGVAYKF